MRLNKQHKTDFVAAVLKSIPIKHKYDKEEAASEMRKRLYARLPKEIKIVLEKWPDLIKTENRINAGVPVSDRLWDENCMYVICHESCSMLEVDNSDLVEKYKNFNQEQEQRDALRLRLEEIVSSATSLKNLKDLFPELVDFMPKEQEKSRNQLVSTAGIVTELFKAGLEVKNP